MAEEEKVDLVARGSGMAAVLLAQSAWSALILEGLVKPDRARELLDTLALQAEMRGPGTENQVTRWILAQTIETLGQLPAPPEPSPPG